MTKPAQDSVVVAGVIRRINDAWTSGDWNDLEGCLHDDVVFVQPDLETRADGRAACVKSYADFVEAATIQGFQASDPTVDVWGDTAVVTYTFEIDYEMNGERARESGRDLFVLTRTADGWRAAWRTLIPGGAPA